LATGLVPTQGVLAFLDPVFHIPSTTIDLGHLAGREPGVGKHKTDPREKLASVPLDFGHYPARPAPTLGLVVEVNDPDLDATPQLFNLIAVLENVNLSIVYAMTAHQPIQLPETNSWAEKLLTGIIGHSGT